MSPLVEVLRDIAVFASVVLVAMAAGGLMLFGAAYLIDCCQRRKALRNVQNLKRRRRIYDQKY